MANVNWTKEQSQAIYEKGSNILVAAAAGSGKTAVLVERIINKVINDNIDIDKILIVTFTSAAASEMRERILEAIYKKIEEEPTNLNLQRQIILLNKSNISTIHSFCLDIIRNNFYEIDASANFRVADSAEIDLLKQEIIEELFEEKYIEENNEFKKLLEIYTNYRDDNNLKDLILGIYRFIQSSPFPNQWLEEQVEKFNLENKIENDFAETIWGQILLNNFKEELVDSILKLKQIEKNLGKYDELLKFKIVISEDIEHLENIKNNTDSWEKSYNLVNELVWAKWPSDKKITLDYQNEAKKVRDSVKKKIASIIEKYLLYNSKQANQDIFEMYEVLKNLKDLVIEFSDKFSRKKKEKNIIDFNDIEHFALKILLKVENNRIYETDVARKYKEKFEEIAIDEYQDSNLVQEYILKSVSRGNNIFMVGDVKQSIYKFRQARPELFLDKYEKYKLKNEDTSNGMKIQLFKNFRSRTNILDLTNLVFENIMSKSLGDIIYNENEYLNYGANYPSLELEENNIDMEEKYAGISELHIIDLKKQEDDIYKEDKKENQEEAVEAEGEERTEERIEDVVLEAKYVAKQIKDIINSGYMVYDKKQGYRKITYKDIVVLLRSTKVPAPIFEKEISNLNIPVFSDVSSEYLETMEIQTIMSLLKIIDNPMQDIPLITVLRSSIGGFTDNELVVIRKNDRDVSFYESLVKSMEFVHDELKDKINIFLNNLKKWQKQEKYMSLDELIWQIYSDTNFYNYVTLLPNGGLRQANLKMLFERAKQYESASFKGLFNFINFIDKLHSNSGDLSSAKLIGENENVVRIMSIHKSKGLEFPVVFLSCMGKQFNLQDLNENIILHQDLGFGPTYINTDKKIEYTTLAKEAIRLNAKVETLSEEMRVLYVALTRAKEKIIITGISKDIEKSFKEKEELIQMYNDEDNEGINHILLKKYKTYLDWLILIYFNNKEKIEGYLKLNIIQKDKFLNLLDKDDEIVEINLVDNLNNKAKLLNDEKANELYKILKWKYYYTESSSIPTKTSVTKLKEIENEQIISLEELEQKESMFSVSRPQFLNEDVKITNAQKGTLMHLCFQKLNEKKEYTKDNLKNLIDDLVYRKIITPMEGNSININKLYSYTKSDLYNQIKKAKYVFKEQPFYINLTSDEVYGNGLEDNILVQGIIDLYFINENDEVILVDYKTDYVEKNKEQELIDKYKKQLDIYKKALEQSLKKNIHKTYIYSVYLEKLIEI
ncbi:MAG: helicase-exonuclease AddAB subunit AddA [Clostridiales bacterium]|nr:helicase-exonuclease AddAB subunit AddA [Clostridiales bacterium]